jgi:hypothetical protein
MCRDVLALHLARPHVYIVTSGQLWRTAMFKLIGGLVVYGFAAYGLTLFLEHYESRADSDSDRENVATAAPVFNVVK